MALVLVGALVIGGVLAWLILRAPSAPVSLSLTEAQQQVPFTIPQPKWLPDGLIFQEAHAASPNWVRLTYERTDVQSGYLDIEITHGARVGKYDYPETAGQPVRVNGIPAVYVHGGTYERGWDASADAGSIEWTENGYIYLVSYSQLSLSRDDLIHIAEALK